MDRASMIAAILNAIQSDEQLIALFRILVTNNINNVTDMQVTMLYNGLGLSNQ